jgi:hypothetical protein
MSGARPTRVPILRDDFLFPRSGEIMTDAAFPQFKRYADANGRWRSICMKCFLTVAAATSEAELDAEEQVHDCGQFFNAKRTSLAEFADDALSTGRKAS